jgi:hydrogenase nickel incorporation protein HypA/HybF
MHELPIMKSIFHIVLKHAQAANAEKVLSVNLEIGALTDLQDEWVQRYFDYLSLDTVAEGAKLRINRVPATFLCNRCRTSFEVESLVGDDLSCARCHSRAVTLVSGKGYQVRDIEVL